MLIRSHCSWVLSAIAIAFRIFLSIWISFYIVSNSISNLISLWTWVRACFLNCSCKLNFYWKLTFICLKYAPPKYLLITLINSKKNDDNFVVYYSILLSFDLFLMIIFVDVIESCCSFCDCFDQSRGYARPLGLMRLLRSDAWFCACATCEKWIFFLKN